MKNLILILLVGWLALFSQNSYSQEEPDTIRLYSIEMSDGNKYFGTMISQNPDYIELSTKVGTVRLQRNDIKAIHIVDNSQIKNGRVWYPNLQSTRYFFAPNGYGLKQGEVYYQNVWIFFNQFSVGVFDYFSIGAGLVPAFLFAGSPTPIWIIPKVSVPIIKEKLNIGAGGLFGTVVPEENTGFGLAYGLVTLGSRDRNITVGVGYGYADKQWTDLPLFTLSAMVRASPRAYFITENYVIPMDGNLNFVISLGGRSMINRVGLDYGLVMPAFKEQGVFFAFPWLGITIPLHKPKVDAK